MKLTFCFTLFLVIALATGTKPATRNSGIRISAESGVLPNRFAHISHGRQNNVVGLKQERAFMEILGIVSEVMGVYDSITEPSNGDLQNQINEGFNRVEQQLNNIQQSINDMINIIIDQSIRNQYVTTERVITESLRCYNAYSSMTEEADIAYWRSEFLKWGSFLRESVSFLLDGMLGRGLVAGDVFISIVNSENNAPGRIQSRTNEFMGLINSGIYLHGAFVDISNISSQANAPVRELFSSSYNEIAIRVADKIVECEDETNVEAEMSALMEVNRGLSNEEFIPVIYNQLSSRYDTRRWFVIVYNPLSGFDNHALEGWFRVAFRIGNKNAAAVSFPMTGTPVFSQAAWDALNSFPCNNYNSAINAVNALGDLVRQVEPNVQIAAVKRYSGLFGQYDDLIDVYWNNCASETVIALPPPFSAKKSMKKKFYSKKIVGH